MYTFSNAHGKSVKYHQYKALGPPSHLSLSIITERFKQLFGDLRLNFSDTLIF